MKTKKSLYVFLVLAAFEMYAILQTMAGEYFTQWFLVVSIVGVLANLFAFRIAQQDGYDVTAPVIGVVAHCFGWILLLGWTLHFAAFVAYIWTIIERVVLKEKPARICSGKCAHSNKKMTCENIDCIDLANSATTTRKVVEKVTSEKKKVVATKKTTTKEKQTVKKAAKKSSSKKGATKKATKKTVKKAIKKSGVKKTSSKKVTSSKAVKKDNLTKIEGVGPKIASVLADNKINTFADLARYESQVVQKILDENKLHRHNAGTWPEQAALARDEKWTELTSLQKKLRGGRKNN